MLLSCPAAIQEPGGKLWLGVKMEMGESGVKGVRYLAAAPACAGGFPCGEAVAGVVHIVVVEFVDMHRLSPAQQQPVPVGSQRRVAEADEMPGIEAAALQIAHHGLIQKLLLQI